MYFPLLALADLISLEDAMEELELGPNGGLVYCMEYLLDNMDWLKDELDKFDEDEYIIFDCPGQVGVFIGINSFPAYLSFRPKGQSFGSDNARAGSKCMEESLSSSPVSSFVNRRTLLFSKSRHARLQ